MWLVDFNIYEVEDATKLNSHEDGQIVVLLAIEL
jgi:hypothetical protein